jgi:carboxylesterase type B
MAFNNVLGFDAENVLNILPPHMPWSPSVDGKEVIQPPLSVISATGLHSDSDTPGSASTGDEPAVLIGYNRDEGTIFAPALFAWVNGVTAKLQDETMTRKALETLIPCVKEKTCDLDDIMNTYAKKANDIWQMKAFWESESFGVDLPPLEQNPFVPADSDRNSSQQSLAAKVIRDFLFACPSLSLADALVQHNVETFMYYFQPPSGQNLMGLHSFGAHHMSELFYIFGNGFLLDKIYRIDDNTPNAIVASYLREALTSLSPINQASLWDSYNNGKIASIGPKGIGFGQQNEGLNFIGPLDVATAKSYHSCSLFLPQPRPPQGPRPEGSDSGRRRRLGLQN